MNSCLYDCAIMHCRVKPKRYQFTHNIFMFYLDLDELETISQRIPIFSRNRPNIYSFFDADHLSVNGTELKSNVINFLTSKGINEKISKIKLLTNVRSFGHIFNPVSFYFCWDKNQKPICIVVEICNTFREIKPFLIGPDKINNGQFVDQQEKFFYISPFLDLDLPMQFKIKLPDDSLEIFIDDIQNGEKVLYSSVIGKKKELSLKNLIFYTLKFPFVTLKVIGLIHWHAFILYLKRLSYHPKEDNPEQQRGVYRVWKKSNH